MGLTTSNDAILRIRQNSFCSCAHSGKSTEKVQGYFFVGEVLGINTVLVVITYSGAKNLSDRHSPIHNQCEMEMGWTHCPDES